jgi:hypothetical protein
MAHEPGCVAAAWANRRWAWRHTNLVCLTCLLEHPSWRLASSMEAVADRQLGGGARGERAGRDEEAARWRQARQTGSGGEYGVEEAARRRPQGMRRDASGDQRRRDGIGWADGQTQGENSAASIGARGWDERIGSLDERRV